MCTAGLSPCAPLGHSLERGLREDPQGTERTSGPEGDTPRWQNYRSTEQVARRVDILPLLGEWGGGGGGDVGWGSVRQGAHHNRSQATATSAPPRALPAYREIA